MRRELDHKRRKRRVSLTAAILAGASILALLPATSAAAANNPGGNNQDGNSQGSSQASTYAVYGDSPYATPDTTPDDPLSQFHATPQFIETINADPDVSGVIHVGDLHSGSENCTQAYDQAIANFWKAYEDPVYYTPGDNEWADCQKAKQHPEFADTYQKGDPIANLALVRQLFFRHPGITLGQDAKHVMSQASAYDPNFPTDKQYAENTIWTQSRSLFVTINVPGGSNNDHDIWNPFTTGTASETQAQHDEYTNRTAADLRWLDTAFTMAKAAHDTGVVVLVQADMWDTEKNNPAILTNYTPFVSKIADRTRDFGGTVLLINGDTHVYRSDDPLVNDAPCVSELPARCAADHDAYDLQPLPAFPGLGAAKFHRIVVHGSTNPMEWLKLTIDPSQNAPESANAVGPFSWSRQIQALP